MIIDTHTHFYDPARPQGIPWPPKNNALLYRTVLPEHARAVAEPLGVTGTVVVEASPWLEDNQWILDLAAKDPFIVGFIGNLNPSDPNFEQHLDRFCANPVFRGIRLGLRRGTDAELEALMPQIERLAVRNLTLDMMTNAEYLTRNTAIPRRFPELRIVIDHIAHAPITGEAPDPKWAEGIQAIAQYPNVYVKVSALAEMAQTQPAPADPAYYAPTLDALWNAFGENRLVFGSNWPVCERAAPYRIVHHIVADYFNSKGTAASDKYFYKNGQAAYQWRTR